MANGHKTGGRQKGTPNKSTLARKVAIAESGLSPLDFMLSVMRDNNCEFDTRLDAAKSAAPYVHPKLAAIDLSFQNMTDDEIRSALAAEFGIALDASGIDEAESQPEGGS